MQLTNSYWTYAMYHQLIGTKRAEVLSHYEYIKAIALAWIEPEEYAPQRVIRKRKSREDRIDHSEVSMRSRTRRANVQSTASTVVSGLTTEDGSSTSRNATTNATINDKSLNPSNGKLKCRLNSNST